MGSYSTENGLGGGLHGRGGEGVWVLVDGVTNDQASMSSRMPETSGGSGVLVGHTRNDDREFAEQ
jgi:hypothetical protein